MIKTKSLAIAIASNCMRSIRRPLLVVTMSLLPASAGMGATVTAVNSGNWSNSATWGGTLPASGDDVVIGTGKNVVLDTDPPALGRIDIAGRLQFQRANRTLTARHIMVHHGELEIGTVSQPFAQKATIVLTGTNETENILIHGESTGTKGLVVMHGTLRLHGARASAASWTKLSANAGPNATQISVLNTSTGWRVGDQIVIAPSGFNPQEAEKRTITAVSGRNITFTPALSHSHYGTLQTIEGRTVDTRAEVALLTRDIVIRGADDSLVSDFGGHMMFHHESQIFVEGVELFRMGQKGHRGRYPMHFHFTGDGTGSYIRNNSVHQSFHRGILTHGVDKVLVESNVCYDIWSHTFVPAEDGTELHNVFQNNIAILTKRLPEEDFAFAPRSSTGIKQSEWQPANYWTTSTRHTLIGNVAAGCDVGMGFFYDLGRGASVSNAQVNFHNNVAHAIKGILGGNDRYSPNTTGHGLFLQQFVLTDRQVWSGFVGYKNTNTGIWTEEHNQAIVGATLVDNGIGILTHRGSIEDSVIIGQSGNTIGGPAPIPGVDNLSGGLQIMRGQGGQKRPKVRNVTFINQRHAGIMILDADLSLGGYVHNCTYIRTRPVYIFRPGFNGRLLDQDGSTSGTGVPSLISMYSQSAASVYIADWRAWVTPLSESSNQVIVDNAHSTGVSFTGTWATATSPTGFLGANYRHDDNAGKGTKSALFTPAVTTQGWYNVYGRWPGGTAASTNVPFTINYMEDRELLSVNQQAGAGTWVPMGTYYFGTGSNVGRIGLNNTGTTGHAQADAFRVVLLQP